MLISLLLKQDYCYLKRPSEAAEAVEAGVALRIGVGVESAGVGVEEKVLGLEIGVKGLGVVDVENRDLKTTKYKKSTFNITAKKQ